MIETIREAVKFLSRYIPDKSKKHPGIIGLNRMRELTSILGNPQNAYKTIHIAGTSGKGSTATILASILGTKYKTGLHTSPHLVRINERIKVLSEEITDAEFVGIINEVQPAVLKMEKRGIAPSYFEIVTAAAFVFFKKKEIEIAVIEAGMGGRYDATNVVQPETCILTNVGLDHTEVLGKTVEEIATDKSGIIKKNSLVITGAKQTSVLKIITEKARQTHSKLEILNNDFKIKILKVGAQGSYFNYYGKREVKNLFIPLAGAHQAENAAVAIRAAENFAKIKNEDIHAGVRNAYIPGRMEIISINPLIILDGAHNPDKIRALVAAVKTIWPRKAAITVLAIKEDKNSDEMLKIILPISREIILTSFESLLDLGKVLSISPEKLKRKVTALNYQGNIDIVKDPKKAIENARVTAAKEDIILVTGSLYLIGKIKATE